MFSGAISQVVKLFNSGSPKFLSDASLLSSSVWREKFMFERPLHAREWPIYLCTASSPLCTLQSTEILSLYFRLQLVVLSTWDTFDLRYFRFEVLSTALRNDSKSCLASHYQAASIGFYTSNIITWFRFSLLDLFVEPVAHLYCFWTRCIFPIILETRLRTTGLNSYCVRFANMNLSK